MNELNALIRQGHLELETITWREELSLRAWAKTDARREAIRRLIERGDPCNARREMREHNKRLSVRLTALFAAARRNRKSAGCATATERETLRLKRLEDVLHALGEVKSFAHPALGTRSDKAKSNGGVRTLTRFHWVEAGARLALKLQTGGDRCNRLQIQRITYPLRPTVAPSHHLHSPTCCGAATLPFQHGTG